MLLISAFFSSSETSIMSLNRYKLRHLANKKHKKAQLAIDLLNQPDKLIGSILLGNNLVNILASSIATIIGMRMLGDIGIAVSTAILTIIVLIFAEITPKTIAASHPEKVAFKTISAINLISKILAPILITITFFSQFIIRRLKIDTNQNQKDNLSKEEIQTILKDKSTNLKTNIKEMMLSLLEIDSVCFHDIMVEKKDFYSVDIEDNPKTIIEKIEKCKFTNIIVYKKNTNNIIGYSNAHLLRHINKISGLKTFDIYTSLQQPYIIQQNSNINEKLKIIQYSKNRVAFIVNEYGEVQGLITLSDIFKYILCDYTENGSGKQMINKQADGSYIVDAKIKLRQLNKQLNLELPLIGPKTLNGLILEYIEDIPHPNSSIKINNDIIEIIDIAKNMINLVKIMPYNKQG